MPDDFVMDSVECIGNEASINDCPHDNLDDCRGDEGAGVECKGTIVDFNGVVSFHEISVTFHLRCQDIYYE